MTIAAILRRFRVATLPVSTPKSSLARMQGAFPARCRAGQEGLGGVDARVLGVAEAVRAYMPFVGNVLAHGDDRVVLVASDSEIPGGEALGGVGVVQVHGVLIVCVCVVQVRRGGMFGGSE